MKKTLLATVLLSLTMSAFAASKAPAPAPAANDLPPALAGAQRAGVKVEKSFKAISGLTGYVINRNGEYSVVFATPDKMTLINGMVLAPDGKNMTQIYGEQYIPKPDYDALWAPLQSSQVIVTGATGKNVKSVVYAFLDPNCGFCHLAYKAFLPYEKAGLQVRWVPVAFLGPTSPLKVAAILQASDPTAALVKHEESFSNGGISVQGIQVAPSTGKVLDKNGELMKSFGIGGTPALVYKDKSGKVLVKNGMPRLSELPDVFNLPAQPNTDEELKRFE